MASSRTQVEVDPIQPPAQVPELEATHHATVPIAPVDIVNLLVNPYRKPAEDATPCCVCCLKKYTAMRFLIWCRGKERPFGAFSCAYYYLFCGKVSGCGMLRHNGFVYLNCAEIENREEVTACVGRGAHCPCCVTHEWCEC